MKIIYLGAFRFPKQDAAAARVLSNAKILRDLGHQISFISWGGESFEIDRTSNNEYKHDGFNYINTHEIRNTKGNLLYKIKG